MRKRLYNRIKSLRKEGTPDEVVAQILLTAELMKSTGVDIDLAREAITRAALTLNNFYYELMEEAHANRYNGPPNPE